MKKVLFLFFLTFDFIFANSLGLSKTDLIVLNKIKSLTDEPVMKYSLMAIAVKETSVGKNMANFDTNDFGLFQSNIKSVLSRQYVADTPANRKYFALRLMNDVGFATANAIVELEYWRNIHKDNWIKIWSSYNTGYSYKSDTGILYAKDILEIIKKLKNEYQL